MSHGRKKNKGVWLPPGGVTPAYYAPGASDNIVLGSEGGIVQVTGSLHISGTLRAYKYETIVHESTTYQGSNTFGNDSGDTHQFTGKVGVGVSDPDSLLEIYGTSAQFKISHNANDYATLTVADTGDLTIATVGDGTTDSDLILDADGDIEINADGGDITFKDASNTLGSFDSSGNFNIAGELQTTNIGYTDGDNAITIADGGGCTFAAGITSTAAGNTFGTTTLGATTADSVTIDNITINGTEIDLSSGDLTIDVAGDVILDADGGEIFFKDAGIQQGVLKMDTANSFILSSSVSTNDFYIKSGRDIVLDAAGSDILFKESGTTFASLTEDGDDAYFNFGSTAGSSGYGFFDDAGTLKFKNSGGSWSAFSSGGAVSAIANGADNRIATFSSSDALNGESNLTFDGSTLTLTGDIRATGDITATGDIGLTGNMSITGQLTSSVGMLIPDDAKLRFGTGRDASIEYDEDGTDELRFAGAAATFEQAVSFDANVTLGNAAADVATVTAQLTASEGLTSTGDAFFNSDVTLGNAAADTITSTGQLTASQGALFNNNVRVTDNNRLYFGTDEDALIEYDEAGDNYLIISGSASGIAMSGSAIAFDGNVKIKSDYHTTTFENQLADGDMGSGEILYYEPGADTTLTKGGIYFLHTDGTWDATDADAAATSKGLLGIALGTSARTDGMLIRGFVKIPSTEVLNLPGSGASDGLPVYISTTAAHLDFTAPSASGDIVRVVGYCIDDDSSDILLYFKPDNTWVEIA